MPFKMRGWSTALALVHAANLVFVMHMDLWIINYFDSGLIIVHKQITNTTLEPPSEWLVLRWVCWVRTFSLIYTRILSDMDRLWESPLKSLDISMRSFRHSSILSYHLATSRDIALQLAEQEIQIETLSFQRTLESAKWGLEPTWTVQCCHSAFSGSATALLCMWRRRYMYM